MPPADLSTVGVSVLVRLDWYQFAKGRVCLMTVMVHSRRYSSGTAHKVSNLMQASLDKIVSDAGMLNIDIMQVNENREINATARDVITAKIVLLGTGCTK